MGKKKKILENKKDQKGYWKKKRERAMLEDEEKLNEDFEVTQ